MIYVSLLALQVCMITVGIDLAFLSRRVVSFAELGHPNFLLARARLAAAWLFVRKTALVGSVICEFKALLLRVHNHVSNLVAEICFRQKRQVHGCEGGNHVLLAVSLFDKFVVALG